MKQLTLLFLLFANIASAQQANFEQGSSQFDKFVIDPKVEWASYYYDTLKFVNAGFNKILTDRFEKNEIKASWPIMFDFNKNRPIEFTSKKVMDRLLTHHGDLLPIYDSLGNPIKTIPKKLSPPLGDITDITEIIYIEKGQLKSYVPVLSPMLTIITSFGVLLGHSDYFSACFNFNPDYLSAKTNKILLLSETKRKMIPDSTKANQKLKELYGRNLVQTLWPYALKNKFVIISIKTGEKIKADKLTRELLEEPLVNVPNYDSLGNLVAIKAKPVQLSGADITSVELQQEWYYDYTKNIVFTKIRSAVFYAKKWTPDGMTKEDYPILKLLFK